MGLADREAPTEPATKLGMRLPPSPSTLYHPIARGTLALPCSQEGDAYAEPKLAVLWLGVTELANKRGRQAAP